MNAPTRPDPRRPGYAPLRIMPQSYEDVREIAREAVLAGLFRAPEGTPPEVTQAQCVFAIMTGLDAGMTPAQAVQAIYVKDGKCNITGQGCLALIRGAGFLVDLTEATEANGWKASCTITRSNGEVISREYTKYDAMRAGLWRDEPDMSSSWWTAQTQMLQWRAVGRVATFGAPDVLRGLHILELTNADVEARGNRGEARPQIAALPEVPDDIDQERVFLDKLTGVDAWDSERYLGALKTACEAAQTATDLQTVWDWHLDVSDGKLSQADQDQAKTFYEQADVRVG